MDGGGEVTLGISLSLFGAVKDVAVQPRAKSTARGSGDHGPAAWGGARLLRMKMRVGGGGVWNRSDVKGGN